MAKKPPEAEKENSERWLLTYSDMITLLLALFIVMYAISSVDAQKYEAVAAAMEGAFGGSTNTQGLGPDNADGMGGGSGLTGTQAMFDVYAKGLQSSDMSTVSGVESGDGKLKITFNGDLMFAPNSAEMLPRGKEELYRIMNSLRVMMPYVSNMSVEGHTAGNDFTASIDDWDLSSDRAKNTLEFMDSYKILDGEKFQMMAFGPYKPITGTDPTDAANRRVELIILRNDFELSDNQVIMDIMKYDYNEPLTIVDSNGNPIDGSGNGSGKLSIIDIILGRISDHYYSAEPAPSDTVTEAATQIVGPHLPGDLSVSRSDLRPVDEEGKVIPEEAPAEAEGGEGAHGEGSEGSETSEGAESGESAAPSGGEH